jgi:alpha-L-fucosidase 2
LRFEIELLPALPGAWPTGSIRGLRARGGFDVDIAWSDRCLTSATITSRLGNQTRLRYGKQLRLLRIAAGDSYTWQPAECFIDPNQGH